MELRDPHGKILKSKKNHLEMKVSLTTSESGNYEVCVKHNDKKKQQIDYQLLTGIQAQDSSQYARESSIQPAEAAIIKLKNMTKGLIKDFNKVIKEEDKNLKVNDIISGKIPMVSIITISVMIIVGLIEFIYITKYLQKTILTQCILQLSGREYKMRLYQIENLIESIKKSINFKRTLANCIIELKSNIIYIKIN